MGCGSCSTGNGCGTTGGCKSGGCATGGCNKLNTFDWFGNMLPPDISRQEMIHEIRFKSTHKGFYKNVNGLDLITGDIVAVEAERGYDIGTISLSGELTRLQMRKKKVHEDKVLKIYRKATPEDLEKLKLARSRELDLLYRSREIIRRLKVEMKLTELEIQGDNTKGTFYYTADNRVDFRELIKVFAEEFRIRIEMKQIGLRQEAGLLGGIGSCGRELCCSTWLTDFKNVSTGAARYQNISLNPMKISGQCGRLKCCLNYELETYMDALKGIPEVHSIETELGVARLQKTDIFKKKMWFSYGDSSDWHGVDVRRVNELIALNKKGIKPAGLLSTEELQAIAEENRREKEMDFVDVVGQSRINERPLSPNKKKKKKKRPVEGSAPRMQNASPGTENTVEGAAPAANPAPKSRNDSGPNRGPRPDNRNQNPGNRGNTPNPRPSANTSGTDENKSESAPQNRRPNPRPPREGNIPGAEKKQGNPPPRSNRPNNRPPRENASPGTENNPGTDAPRNRPERENPMSSGEARPPREQGNRRPGNGPNRNFNPNRRPDNRNKPAGEGQPKPDNPANPA